MLNVLRAAVCTAAVLMLAPVPVAAQTTAPAAAPTRLVPVEDFVRRPKMVGLRYSPDGKRFAVTEEFNGRMNLVVGNVAGGPLTRLTNFRDQGDVGGFAWAGNERIVFSLIDLKRGLAEQAGGGLFVVRADGASARELSPTVEDCVEGWRLVCRYTSFLATDSEDGRTIIVESNDRNLRSSDVYRLDVETNRRTLLTQENPGRVVQWVLDAQRLPRAALSSDGRSLTNTFWFRETGDGPWRKVLEFKEFEGGIRPLGFGPDGTLYVSSNRKTDTAAVYKFDVAAGGEGERIAFHPKFDIAMQENDGGLGGAASPLIFDPKTKELIGLRVDGDKPETYWLREAEQRVQATIDRALPGADNRLRRIGDGRYSVLSVSDRDPGTYFLFDPEKRQLMEVGRPRAWINPAQMGKVEVVRYKARDGLEIPAYLTTPAGKEPKGLPLVVWVHGGPWARDEWGWDPEVQFMASRGYAVLQVNYRGSTGFGLKHLTSSFKKLGQQMQDDLTDGVLHLVDKGIVDRQRVCIGGGSYGGYATMMGLAKEPGLFKCGINVVGVTDLFWWLELGYTDFNRFDPDAAGAWLRMTVGDPATDAAMMRAYSPRLLADRIKAPVLIAHGGGDQRVPIKHAEGMREALRTHNVPFEWVVYPEEGHGFLKESNRLDYFKRVEAFLAKHLGPGR
jgi:dipeptidyl aminopeptidase/acylaminoacyl peptidase